TGRGGAPHCPPEPLRLAGLASADDPAGAGRVGGALAGGHHHAAVVAGGGGARVAPVSPLPGAGVAGRRAGGRRRPGHAMTILYLLLPLSLLFVLVIGLALGWAVFNGQFDEPDDAAASILSDRDASETSSLRFFPMPQPAYTPCFALF